MAANFKRRRRGNSIKIGIALLVLALVCGGGFLFFVKYLKSRPAPIAPPPVLSVSARMAQQPSATQNMLAEIKIAYPKWLSAKAAQKALDDAAAAKATKAARSHVSFGAQYGSLWVENTSIQCALLYGDNEAQFSRGAGTSAAGKLPGDGGTVLIASHTGTYFADLGSAAVGSLIHLDTDWGNYTYRVTDARVVEETDIAACRLDAPYENCILYTCYPFGQLTPTPHRWFVFAEFVNVSFA